MLSLVLLFSVAGLAQVTLPGGGTLSGGQCSSSNAQYYYSVPYAQPPTDDLRFAAPQPYSGSYDGDYTTLTPNCPQFGEEFIEMTAPSSEDCLYLNIWAPPNAQDLPVKFWIYGGGNTAGSVSNPTYNGCNLANDSIVVSVNYRLGPLGFLALQSGGVHGNMGIQDQLLGLQWVQDNIQAFGGDPSKVVLFGESAGASDTYVISTLPQAPSLIQSGISESGGGGVFPGAAAANAFGEQWTKSLNCSDATCLRSLSLAQLNVSLPENTVPSYNPYSVHSFGAFVDGSVIPAQPAEVGVQVPFIYGANAMEYTLLILSQPGVSSPGLITPEVYQQYLKSTFGSSAPTVAAQYPISAFSDTPFPAFYALVQVATESSFWCPSYQGLRKAVEIGSPAWTYRWGQAPSCPWYTSIPPSILPIFGASHTSEIPFVFNNIETHPLVYPDCQFTDNEIALSKQMVGFWTSMATHGNPGNGWPQFESGSTSGINVVNGSASVTPGTVDYSVCDFWSQVQEAVIRSSNTSVVNGGYAGSARGAANATGSSSAASSSSVPSASVVPATGGASAHAVMMNLALLVSLTTSLYLTV